jgi:sugar phosphate isomerase/epimerase
VLKGAGVELFSVLIDAGDITHPDPAARAQELAWVRSWVEVAARCGASCARVIAGDAEVPPGDGEAVLRLSAEGLRGLARFGREQGVRVITENFRALARRTEHLLKVLDMCEGEVGLCADFGNFRGPTKYDDLRAILPRADSVHAKAHYPAAGEMDREDFVRCMELTRAAGFDGPYSLIFDGPGSEWDSLSEIQEVVKVYL